MRRVATAFLYLPPGVTFDQYLQPPFTADEIVRASVLQFQIVIGDLLMVRPQLTCFLTT